MNNKKIRVASIAFLLASMLLFASAIMYSSYVFEMVGRIKSAPEDPLEAWSENSYIVWQYNSTFYACRNMSTLMNEYFGSSDDYAIQWGIDNASSGYGGSVYVKNPSYTGTYNAAVTLKDKVTLIIEQGAAGITVTIDSGATATLLDYHAYDFKHWDSGTLSHEVETWREAETASYVISRQGSIYRAKNGSTGVVDYSGTNATTVTNNAINALTSGRTWKEKVVLMGDWTLTGTIEITNYTVLEIQGKLTATDNLDRPMISNVDWTNGNSHFEIRGGTLDGNKANQPTPSPAATDTCEEGIVLERVTDVVIDGMTIQNHKRYGISIGESVTALTPETAIPKKRITISNNRILSNEANNIYANVMSESRIINNYIYNATSPYGLGGAGIHIYYSVAGTSGEGNIIANNVFHNNQGWGVSSELVRSLTIQGNTFTIRDYTALGGWAIELGNGEKTSIVGNTINQYERGIHIAANLFYNTVIGNTFYNISESAIYIDSAYNTIQGNTIVNAGIKTDDTYDAIYINNQHNIIIGNHIRQAEIPPSNIPCWGIYEATGANIDYNVLIGNDVQTGRTGAIWVNATDTNVNLCWNGTTWIP